jgi:DNA-binding NtrC family response regulator
LRNILERAVLLGDRRVLTARDLHFDVRGERDQFDNGSITRLEEVEKKYIAGVLKTLGEQVPEAARKLGIPRSSLYNKIKLYRISLGTKGESSSTSSDEPASHEG